MSRAERESFKQGYEHGLRAGYDDGINLREFRALNMAKAAAEGLETAPDSSSHSNFDLGFAAGYRIGTEQEGEITHGDLGYAQSCAKAGFSPLLAASTVRDSREVTSSVSRSPA